MWQLGYKWDSGFRSVQLYGINGLGGGNHSALRHGVLCLHFIHLRCVTGHLGGCYPLRNSILSRKLRKDSMWGECSSTNKFFFFSIKTWTLYLQMNITQAWQPWHTHDNGLHVVRVAGTECTLMNAMNPLRGAATLPPQTRFNFCYLNAVSSIIP